MQAQEAGAVSETPSFRQPKRKGFTSEQAKAAITIREANRKARKEAGIVPETVTQVIDGTYKASKEDWAKIEATFRFDIAAAQRKGDKTRLVGLVTAAAIAHDKAYKHQIEEQPLLIAPPPVVSKLIDLAVAQSVPSDNNELHDSLHNASYVTAENSLSSSKIEHEAGGGGLGDGTPAP